MLLSSKGWERGCSAIVWVCRIANRREPVGATEALSQKSLTPSHLHDLSKNLHVALRGKRNRLSGQNKHTYCVLLLSTGQNVHVVIFTLFASARNLFTTFYHLIDWFRVCHFHFVCFATG